MNRNMNNAEAQTKTDFSYQAVINCYLRETRDWTRIEADDIVGRPGLELPGYLEREELRGLVVIPLPTRKGEIAIGVRYWSLTGRHQFHFPVLVRELANPAGEWAALSLSEFVTVGLQEVAARLALSRQPEPEQLLAKIFDSRANIDRFIRERADDIEALNGGGPQSFIESEQALLIGHQTHPTAKSREGFSHDEMARYSPELRGSFPLHFFRVHPELAHQDSAVPGRSAERIVKDMLRDDETVPGWIKELCDDGRAILPLHPWQARYVSSLDPVRKLLERGLLEDLGTAGREWTPTTSIRTVYRDNFDFMFKFSLSVKITNSVRVSLTRELDRSIEMARLMATPCGQAIQADVPAFGFIQDPAYLSVKWGGQVLEALSCTFRDATFVHGNRDITAITCLVQDHPRGWPHKNRLYRIIETIAGREERSLQAVASDWYRRYLDVSIYNLFKLFFKWGLCFEAHGQNSLLELQDGYPARYLYRDSQGYFHRAAAHEDFCRAIPRLGEATESIFPEDLANERLVYYLIVNQVFSVINALGTQGLADEADLMREFAGLLERVAGEETRYPLDMIDHLLTRERLPCKGNLLTQLFNMDELVGDIATQSVYVDIPNVIRPFAGVRA